MCLMPQTTEKDFRQGSPLSTWMGRATEKDWPKTPSDSQLPEAKKKDSDRTTAPTAEAVCVPAHLMPPGSPRPEQLRHLHTQLSLAQSCHRQKKKILCLCTRGRFVYCLCPIRVGKYWLPYPSRALYFLLHLPPIPSTWCWQNPCKLSSCTTSAPGPHRGRSKSFKAASGVNPSGRPTGRGGNKTTIETQGQCS